MAENQNSNSTKKTRNFKTFLPFSLSESTINTGSLIIFNNRKSKGSLIRSLPVSIRAISMSLLNSVLNQIKLPDPPIDEIWTPMNWRETSEAHVFEISLPGVTKEEVKLEVHQGSVLRIIAERKEEDEELEDEKGGIKWHCKERLNGQMKREFRLPENVKSEEIKASMRDGLLVVIVPKDKMKKKAAIKLKSVDISGDGEETDHRKGIGRFICCKA